MPRRVTLCITLPTHALSSLRAFALVQARAMAYAQI